MKTKTILIKNKLQLLSVAALIGSAGVISLTVSRTSAADSATSTVSKTADQAALVGSTLQDIDKNNPDVSQSNDQPAVSPPIHRQFATAQPTATQPAQLNQLHSEFDQARTCHGAAVRASSLGSQLASCKERDPNDPGYQLCARQTADFDQKIQAANNQLAMCSAGDSASAHQAYYTATKAAARAGDVDAQVCYFLGDFQTNLTDAQVAQYRVEATTFASSALQRGDWRIVAMLATPSDSLTGLESQLPIGKPYEVFRMNRLLRLGATGNYINYLDVLAGNQSARMSQQQIDAANLWAESEYDKYFSKSPKLEADPTFNCSSP